MKQLLIVNSGKALNAGITSGKDLSGLQEGALAFLDTNTDAILSAKPTANFAIALGRPNGQMPFMISEVDLKSMVVTKATPSAGTKFKVVLTMPTPVVSNDYTLVFVKKGTVPHERRSWTVSITAKTTTAATEAESFEKLVKEKISNEFNFTVSRNGAAVTIEAANYNDGWNVMPVDSLSASNIVVTDMSSKLLDKAYVQNLASQCAAGKGFRDTDYQGREFLPGYPEAVEDTTYNLYTIRFAVPRVAAKTRDEVVNQIVHIAVPTTGTPASARTTAIETILGLITPSNS